MKYYNVQFTFNIPVAVKDDDDEIDAYYAARDEFSDFRVNEAKVQMTTIGESKYKEMREEVNKLHRNQPNR